MTGLWRRAANRDREGFGLSERLTITFTVPEIKTGFARYLGRVTPRSAAYEKLSTPSDRPARQSLFVKNPGAVMAGM